MYVIGRESIYGRRSNPVPSERELNFPGAITVFDTSTQRLFGIDRFNNRILVFRAHPDEVEAYPAAQVVIGQKDLASTERGIGPNRTGMMASGALDEEGQRLFVADPPNHRVLVFDIHPDRLDTDPAATIVIGQEDFHSRERGVGPDQLAGPSSVAYDPVFNRLFVSDMGNHRVVVFDVHPDRLTNHPSAIAVMGQRDAVSREPRAALDDLKPETLAYDWVHHRLFIAEDLQHRVMVYDAHPDRVGGPTKALAVIGQPDAFSTHPAVGQDRVAMPRIAVEPETQKLYISEGFPAGNRISIFDITPGKLHTGMFASDVVGHETTAGGPDFEARMAQGHLNGKTLAAARAVALDPLDHRLFVADEYNHRVVVWQLDGMNRVADRAAQWVLGQPDLESSYMGDPSATNMTVPLAVAYDKHSKRLFVGDGYHNRVLVYDARPGSLRSGMAASVVLGQRDFETVEHGAGRDRFSFGVRMGRGIASRFIPMGLAVDEETQRLFVSDGENNRVLVFGIEEEGLANGASAIAVLGQPDFQSTEPGRSATALHEPGHLAYDPQHGRLYVVDARNQRVVVFDASKSGLSNGAPALAVLGQPDFVSGPPPPVPRVMGGSAPASFDDRSFLAPNGLALDAEAGMLYLTDAVIPADRVLVFDVGAKTLENGAPAVAVLGASQTEPGTQRFFGGRKSYPGQFTLRDARGIAVDSEYGRLFVTGSFSSRVVIFNFPRAAWRFVVGPKSLGYFHTPDAIDLEAREEALVVRHARIVSDGVDVSGTALVSVSEMFVDERTQRHSRMLVSEAAFAASLPRSSMAFFIDGATDRKHWLHVSSEPGAPAELMFRLLDMSGDELHRWQETVPADGQLGVVVEERAREVPESATLLLEASRPVSVAALRSTLNGRGDRILARIPSASRPRSQRQVLPWVENGAGSQWELVLVNDGDGVMRGDIELRDRFGERSPLGMDSELMPYAVPPHASRRFRSDGAGPRAESGYAVVHAEGDGAPMVAALVRHRDGDTWTSESVVSASLGRAVRFAVNAEKTLIRHGDIDTIVHITNAGLSAAHVRIGVGDGRSFERTVMPGQQLSVSIGERFGDGVRGILEIESDVVVSVTARQTTVNLRGETIGVVLPALTNGTSFAYVVNGAGLATELRLANTSAVEATGVIELRLPDGALARDALLR